MRVLPIRLAPGTDLRLFQEQLLQEQKEQAGWVLSGIGSLSVAPLRLAGQEELIVLEGDLEILTLSGSLSPDGAHLHISVVDSQGRVSGGHLAKCATVLKATEVLVALLPACSFRRVLDPSTGFTELIILDQA
jgi:predicted DNA-binding protein with PD1-like motif